MSSTEIERPVSRKRPPTAAMPTSGRIRAIHMMMVRLRSFTIIAVVSLAQPHAKCKKTGKEAVPVMKRKKIKNLFIL